MVYAVFGLYTLSGVESGVRRHRLPLSIGPNTLGSYLRTEAESSLRNVLIKKMDDG
jgi:hypothetical protein